jgi:hypothetical protein
MPSWKAREGPWCVSGVLAWIPGLLSGFKRLCGFLSGLIGDQTVGMGFPDGRGRVDLRIGSGGGGGGSILW